MSKSINLMNQFKRSGQQEYKISYELKNPTHLVNVINSLSKFPAILSRISKVDKHNDRHLIEEANKLNNFLNAKQRQVLQKIMWLEKNDKYKIIQIIDASVMNNVNIDREMKELIKNREQALEYATALAIIDDYYEYLEHGTFNGPTTEF